jgi:hypothetical protein
VDNGGLTPGLDTSSNGRVRDRKRPRDGSDVAALLGGKKPKIKKGQDRLAPTGKLRNVYLHSEKLLESLMKEKMAIAYFNVPVDPDLLGIPQYREIIKNPMDLGTIKGKLEGGFYCGVEPLEQDMYLVFDNVSSLFSFSSHCVLPVWRVLVLCECANADADLHVDGCTGHALQSARNGRARVREGAQGHCGEAHQTPAESPNNGVEERRILVC